MIQSFKTYYIAYRKIVNKYSIGHTATKRPEGTSKLSHGTLINHYISQYICYIRHIISILSWLNSLTTTFFMKHVVSSTVISTYLHLDSRCSHEISFGSNRCTTIMFIKTRSSCKIALRTSAFETTF